MSSAPNAPPTTAHDNAALLQVRALRKIFPGVVALDGVDFEVRRGEIHALMGENGAGKSTLIKVLTGVYPRDGGEIRLDGQPIAPAAPRHAETLGLSTVYQEVNLIPHLSVAENICLGREPRYWFGALRWREMRRRAAAALERLGLKLDVRRDLIGYSLAIRQLVAIARALDVSAKLLILDEPTSSLDEEEVAVLFAIMRRLRAQGLGIVFVTHFLDQVYGVSDRITVLRDGRLVGTWEAAKLPRVELVSRMIGRAYEEQRTGGAGSPVRDTEVSAASEQPWLEIRALRRRAAVGPVNLAFRRGKAVGLCGLLGSGRTETARLLFGIDRATAGEIHLDGKTVTIRSPRQAIARGLALTPEDRKTEAVIPGLSIRENIILALQAARGPWRKLSAAEQAGLIARFIRELGIRAWGGDQPVGTLSGGNQQKVILARWLATNPRLLILDEPTRGIDVGTKAEIERLIADACARGMSVLFISSELDETVRTCGRVVVLRDRRQVAELSGPDVNAPRIMATIAAHAEAPRTAAEAS